MMTGAALAFDNLRAQAKGTVHVRRAGRTPVDVTLVRRSESGARMSEEVAMDEAAENKDGGGARPALPEKS